MKNLLLPILIVVLVLGGITLDYTWHGADTWISHVLFWPALAYVALVVANAFRGGSNRATLLLLPLLAAAAACHRPGPVEAAAPVAAVRTYTDAQGYEVVVLDTVQRGW